MNDWNAEPENFLGNRLRELRLDFGFTQGDVAKSLNVSRSTYTYYELGTTRPDPSVLGRLSLLYNVPVEIFFRPDLDMNTFLSDSGSGKRRRTTRSTAPDLKKVGDLSPAERSLILLLRSNGQVDTKELLDYLSQRLSPQKADPAEGDAKK